MLEDYELKVALLGTRAGRFHHVTDKAKKEMCREWEDRQRSLRARRGGMTPELRKKRHALNLRVPELMYRDIYEFSQINRYSMNKVLIGLWAIYRYRLEEEGLWPPVMGDMESDFESVLEREQKARGGIDLRQLPRLHDIDRNSKLGI